MKQEDLMPVSYEDISYRWKPPEGDFIVQVQPLVAKTVNLCGYTLDLFKKKSPDDGKYVYPIYTLDSRKFPPRKPTKGVKSVLPEIMVKLTNPLGPTVSIINTEKVKAEKVKPERTKGKQDE